MTSAAPLYSRGPISFLISYYIVSIRLDFPFFISKGLASVFMNYRIDYEKQLFRMTKGNCRLYGKPAKSMVAVDQITKKTSNLLVSYNTFSTAESI